MELLSCQLKVHIVTEAREGEFQSHEPERIRPKHMDQTMA